MTAETYLLDVNVLVALAWPSHVHHERTHSWFAALDAEWATTPFTETAFVRLSTNAAVVGNAATMSEAVDAVRAMRESASHRFIADDTSLASAHIALNGVVTSRQVTDAHLVNVAAANGCMLATLDRGIPEMLTGKDRRHVFVVP